MLYPIKPWKKAWGRYGVGRKAFTILGLALVLYVLYHFF